MAFRGIKQLTTTLGEPKGIPLNVRSRFPRNYYREIVQLKERRV